MREFLVSLMLASPPSTPPCVQELTPLLQRQEFEALRVAAESCRRSTDHPRTWYYEGLAHLALGRPESAIFSLRKYVKIDASEEPSRLRENARTRLEQAKGQTALVELNIDPSSGDLDTRVEVQRADWEQPLTVFLSELETMDGRASLSLPPGSYIIRAARAGFLPTQRAIVVGAAGDKVPVDLSLRSVPPPPPPPATQHEPQFPTRRWAGAWGGAGGAMLLIGTPMLAVGGWRSWATAPDCSMTTQTIDRCRADLASSTMLQAAGGGFLGSGLGLLIGGLSGLAPGADQRRRAWTAEAALGGVASVTGLILLGVTARSFNRLNNNIDPEVSPWGYDFRLSLVPSERGFFSGAVLLGAGLGLGLSAVLGLVPPKSLSRAQRAQLQWQVQPDGFSLKF